MKKLKLFFACLLMAVLSTGQVWAEDVSFAFSSIGSTGWSNSYANHSVTCADGTVTMNASKQTSNVTDYPVTKGQPVSFVLSDGTKSLSAVSFTCTQWTTKAQTITLKYSTDGGSSYSALSPSVTSTNFSISSSSLPEGTNAVQITFSNQSNQVGVASMSYTMASVTPPSTPSVTVSPTSYDFGTVHASDAASKVFSVSGSNLEAGNLTLTVPTGFSVSPSSIAVDGTLAATEVTVSKNTSDIDDYDGNLEITGGGLENAKTVALTMTIDADPEPTGTFVLFEGSSLEEGDYVICSGTNAMKNTATSSPRIEAATVTVSEDKIVNPDESVIWKVEALDGDDAGYWTFFNEAVSKYAAFTSTDGRGNVIASVTDYAKWNHVAESAYEFQNKGKTGKNLRYNAGYGFASYGTSTGSALTLYKKTDGPILPSADLAFADANHLVKVGASFTAPTLTNPYSVDVTYASGNTDVVAVSEDGETVTIKAAGKAVITASFAGNGSYKAGSASYTIFVAEQAGTAEDPLTEASAKALIDLGCTLTVHVNGLVLSQNSTNFTVTLTNGFQFYKAKDLNNVAFESAYLGAGDEVTAVGALKKYNTTYELDEGCYLTFYEAATTPLTPIANDKDHPYTVAQALAFAAAPTTYDLADHVYIQGVVYEVKNFNSTNGTYDIYIKDAGTSEEDGKFEFYKCSGLYQVGEDAVPFENGDVQEGDEVIGYGVMTYYSGGSIWEFGQPNQLVSLNRPDVPVTGIDLTESTASVEVGSTVTLHASVVPGNATDQGVVWSVISGSDKVSVDENGVVTGVAEGTAVIRAASHEDATINAECTVTVTAVDPTKHTVTFIAGTDQSDETSITKDGITISASTFNNASYYQCYSGAAMTVSSTVGNITKIELTCTTEGTAKYGPGNWDFTGYSYSGANGSWTGSAETVEFGNASQQVRMTLITVTYKEDNREAAGLAWNPAEDIEITVGDEFTAPTLNNPNSIAAGEITIASDNTDLATVSAGVVSLVADATGTATITATFEGNEDYKPAVVSYTITVNEAGLDNVTFDATLDIAGTGELSIAKSGFTLEFTGGAMGNGSEYRLYKNETMSLSSSSYLIKKIEFTCTSGNPISGFADAEGLDKANNQWTGEANSVELTASNAQVRIEKLKVYYIEDTRAASGLEWSTDEIEITLGDPFTPANLINPNSIDASAITIESDNTDLAVVNDGVVSLVADATGTAHIKALFAGNETYKSAKISYTIIVNDPTPTIYVDKLNVNFASVEVGGDVPAAQTITVTLTNVASVTAALGGTNPEAFSISKTEGIVDDDVITISVLANTDAAASYSATITISDGEEGATDKTVNLSFAVAEPASDDDVSGTWTLVTNASALAAGKKVIIAQYVDADGAINTMAEQRSNNRGAVASSVAGSTLSPIIGTKVFTLVDAGDGKIAFKDSENKYLCAASSGSNYLRSQETNDAEGQWIVSIDEDAKATITAQGTYTRNLMRYNPNSGNPIFSCYASSSTTGTLVALYMHEDAPEPPTPVYETVREGLTAGNYYTICYPKAMTDIQGATLWSFVGKDTEFAYIEQETATTIEAGKPYIMYATASTVTAVLGDETNAPGANGAIHGTFSSLTQDQLNTYATVAGNDLYLVIGNELRRATGEGTGSNTLPANRAYVIVDEITSGAPGQAPGRQVRRMPMQKDQAQGFESIEASEKPMKLMIDGKMYILRGEKMYDATGRLVK